jgi:hypothetical protein
MLKKRGSGSGKTTDRKKKKKKKRSQPRVFAVSLNVVEHVKHVQLSKRGVQKIERRKAKAHRDVDLNDDLTDLK